MDIKVAINARAICGESPTWAEANRCLYWIDVKKPALHRSNLSSGQSDSWLMPSHIGAFALIADNTGAVIALRTGIFLLAFSSGSLRPLSPAPFDAKQFRFNDGVCDSVGRLWLGVMSEPLAGNAAPLNITYLFIYEESRIDSDRGRICSAQRLCPQRR